jgi:hypothetical protein
MSIDISHLVVNGCSFAYCQGLDKPHVDGWPALLAKKIGVPVVNLAIGGSSMCGIHRRYHDYFYKSNAFYQQNNIKSNPFNILSLTFSIRREEFFDFYYQNEIHAYVTLNLRPDLDKLEKMISSLDTDSKNIAAFVEYSYYLNNDKKVPLELRKFDYWASLVNLFKANNQNYAVIDYGPLYCIDTAKTVQSQFTDYCNFLYDEKFFGDMNKITADIPKLPCKHESLDAHPIIADYIYNKILDTYGQINAKPIDQYYSLKMYSSSTHFMNFASYIDWI